MQIEINEAVARKVIETVDAGLCSGLGKPVPGQMCVEAAVNYALGLPHGDEPSCVGGAVRLYKIRLNDAEWSSNAARAKGMRKIAVAQLGSNKIDQTKFAEHLVIGTVKMILPIALRAEAKKNPVRAGSLEAAVVACEGVVTLDEAKAAACAAVNAAAYAVNAAYACAAVNADAARAAVNADAARAAAYAADAAAAYTAYAAAKSDSVLETAADVCLDALKACGSEGCKYLVILGLEDAGVQP